MNKDDENNNNKITYLPGVQNLDTSNELTVHTPPENQAISEVIDNLVEEEVRRMQRNLYFLDFLEDELKFQVQERVQNGTLDIGTLQDIIDTLNKSVKRSNSIIKDKNSDLVQILIDNRTQNNIVQQQTESNTSDALGNLNSKSRKKLTNILAALMEASKNEEDKND